MHEFYFAQQQDRWLSNISRWQEILNDPTQICSFKVNNQSVFAGFYFVALAFEDFDNFVKPLAAWFQNKYQCPKDLIQSDLKLALHKNNINTTSWSKWYKLDFYKLDYPKLTNFDRVVTMTRQFKDTGSVLRAKKRWLGVF